ncbi:MAG: hypothetical protein AAF066_19370 [Pseudomonadota bacterium]
MAKGVKTGGRKKGTPNKTTVAAKQAISMAADKLGGVDRLVNWAKEDPANEKVFWAQIYTRIVPLEHDGEIGVVINRNKYYQAPPADRS